MCVVYCAIVWSFFWSSRVFLKGFLMPVTIPGPNQDPLPARDANFAAFATQFAAGWSPASFNVVLPLAATLTAAASAFDIALALVRDPSTTTTPAIAAKNASRAACAALLRGAIRAAQTAFLDGIATEQQLLDLGIRPNSLVRTPIAGPPYPPILALDVASIGSTDLRVTQVDQSTGLAVSTRRYSYGIIGAEFQRKVAAGAYESLGLRKTVRVNDAVVGFVPGTLLMYRCRYMTARGLMSPFSVEVVSAVLS